MSDDIVVVSGLPRSGTSLMMQMLVQGGIEAMTDHIRMADTDNPRGYYELEKVKRLKHDVTWLPEARGKVFKAVAQLMYDFPPSEQYRVVFMERDFDEMLRSQEKMLVRRGVNPAPAEQMKSAFRIHLDRLFVWLKDRPEINLCTVRYNELVAQPQEQAERVAEFVARPLDIERMVAAVDPTLYRNRAEVA